VFSFFSTRRSRHARGRLLTIIISPCLPIRPLAFAVAVAFDAAGGSIKHLVPRYPLDDVDAVGSESGRERDRFFSSKVVGFVCPLFGREEATASSFERERRE
jgi:hypothetical protein